MLEDPETAEDINGDKITLKHLMGDGDWETPAKQASDIPRPILEKVTQLAEKAFLEMRLSRPLQYYLDIFQGPNKHYLQFIERFVCSSGPTSRGRHSQKAGEKPQDSSLSPKLEENFPDMTRDPPLQDPPPDVTDHQFLSPPETSLTMTDQQVSFRLNLKRYHWKVLPQGMKNSPVICQWYVSSLLSPVRAATRQAIIHDYMGNVLVCTPNDDLLAHALDVTVTALVAAGSYVRGIDRDLETTSDCNRSNQVATSHRFCVAHAIEQRKTDDSSESSLSSEEYEDHWATIQGEAAKEGDWEFTHKIMAFPIIVKTSRQWGRRVNWEPISYNRLKELHKTAKGHGRGLHYFKNSLEATFTTHTLIPHDISNMLCHVSLSMAELML
ncbi:hypothetical protein HGM15179_016977 [Zosterops borbonicus]|uniref:ribonuclease H n=1 Tax=Zosterops borbonicus TaxID=364589 RepID=A0A8K1G1N0_9PASS|nr:hypothetical protein HGM15179_016977 [Zosterops borbonicus]